MYIRIPEPPKLGGDNVIISNTTWKAILAYLEEVQEAINDHANALETDKHILEQHGSAIQILSKALGGIYDANS